MPGNTVILANSALEIITGQMTPPHSAVWVTVERDPDCLVCGRKLRHEQALKDAPLSLTDLVDSTGIVIQEEDKDRS